MARFETSVWNGATKVAEYNVTAGDTAMARYKTWLLWLDQHGMPGMNHKVRVQRIEGAGK